MPPLTVRKSVILSWSGGKDSAMALQVLSRDPTVEVVGLLTCITRGYDRISMHGVRRAMLEAQVLALGLPLVEVALDPSCTNDAYEAAFHETLRTIKLDRPGVSHIAFGDLFLEDVRTYRENLLAGSGLDPLFPIWGLDTTALARRFINDGFAACLICVDTTQLDGAFAGRVFDEQLLADFPVAVDPCGERGEFHTFVSDGPGFHASVPYRMGEKVLRDGRFMFCDIE